MSSIIHELGRIEKGVVIKDIDYVAGYGMVLITNKGVLYANEDKVFVPIPVN